MVKDEKITIRISAEEKEALKEYAELRDIPFSQIIREAIREYLNK